MVAYWHQCQHKQQNTGFWTFFGPFSACCTSSPHSELSCVSLLTIKRVEGCLQVSSILFLFVLASPWSSRLLLFEQLLAPCSTFSAWGSVVMAVPLLLSARDFPFFDLTLPDLDFFDLPSLLSEGFTGCCGSVSGADCGWVEGLLAVVACGVALNCEFALLTTTSVRWSSSVCSFAKLTNTYKNEPDIIFFLFTTNLITFEPCQEDTVAFWISTEAH